MGKYMKKAKEKGGDVAVMEVAQPSSSLGVRTRAKTLALQRLQKAAAAEEGNGGGGGGSYLELRSRRLEKPAALFNGVKRQKYPSLKEESNSMLKKKKRRGPLAAEKVEEEKEKEKEEKRFNENLEKNEKNNKEEERIRNGVEDGCFGENLLEEFDGRGRRTRESTPCNLVTDPENVRTPGSSTKHPPTSGSNVRVQNSTGRDIPTTQEMDEFFSPQEEQQRERFIEKYNFDPVNDKPLPGNFEWVKMDL